MSDIILREYKDSDYNTIKGFHLNEEQVKFTSLPIDVIEEAKSDKNRKAIVAENSDGEIVGFFVLHEHYQHEGFDIPGYNVYVRSLSVNDKMQGRGYGTQIALSIPSFVQENYTNLDHLYLLVDADNLAAWNLYERAGFIHSATKEDGPVGPERLYYLDLDQKYVTNIKLKLNETQDDAVTINVVKNNTDVVGMITGRMIEESFNIEAIDIDEDEQKKGYKQSAVRQLGTFLRRSFKDIEYITVHTEFVLNNETLLASTGFVEFNTDNERIYKKLIKY